MKISFIGAGAMATAIVSGLLKKGIGAETISAFDISESASAKFAELTGIRTCTSAEKAAAGADIVILAVKPQNMESAVHQLKDSAAGKLVISIAAGITLVKIMNLTGAQRVIRAMPNTPALIGEGMTALSCSEYVLQDDSERALKIFESVGKVCLVNEKLMDAVTGLSGSGPAYVFDFILALSDAGVINGLTRETSFKLATQTVYGAAKLVIESGQHPSILKENVVSPGGTTAKGLAVLERGAFRGIISEAVTAATERSRELGRD